MKQEIIILSDLWGHRKSDWLSHFNEALSLNYNIKFYNSCELAGIDPHLSDQSQIHNEFLNGGIQKASETLIEKELESRIYIGCSIGGVICWKAAEFGLKIDRLMAISSTRLRKETTQPSFPVNLIFGENDQYKPGSEWFDKMNCEYEIIENGGHDIYKDKLVVSGIVKSL